MEPGQTVELKQEAEVSATEYQHEYAMPISRLRRRARRQAEPLVNLTSMVDVLTVLLFFLLTIYSGGGFLTVLPAGLSLPTSSVSVNLTRNVEVAILKDKILVENEQVSDDPVAFIDNEEMLLPGLQAALAAKLPPPAAPAEGTDPAATPAPAEDARITIEADKSIPFRLLKKVMYTADQAGYRLQSLAVKQVNG